MIDKQIITQISLKENEALQLHKVKKTKQPNYYRIGNGTMNKHNIQSIDLIRELVECSKPAQTVLMWIKDGMQWCPYEEMINFVVKVVPELNSEKQILKKGFKELYVKDLVRRVRRGYYMINPNAIIVQYEDQMEVWDKLQASESK